MILYITNKDLYMKKIIYIPKLAISGTINEQIIIFYPILLPIFLVYLFKFN